MNAPIDAIEAAGNIDCNTGFCTSEPSAELIEPDNLERVEEMMTSLALGDSDERAGRIAVSHLSTGGKRLRARLALGVAECLGANQDDSVAWASAVEMLHNATLVHDDLQDGDRVRRGKPTVWAQHGEAQAINVGDLMLMLPFVSIANVQCARTRAALAEALARYAVRTVRGQTLELDLLPQRQLSTTAYLSAIRDKTGALMALPVYGAAMLAGWKCDQAQRLANAFEPLGLLFQLQDDVRDLYGDKGRGQVACDLYEGKISALIVEHLHRVPTDGAWLLKLLETPRAQTTRDDVMRAVSLLRDSGALRAVLHRIQVLESQVRHDDALKQAPTVRHIAMSLATTATHGIRHLFHDEASTTANNSQQESC